MKAKKGSTAYLNGKSKITNGEFESLQKNSKYSPEKQGGNILAQLDPDMDDEEAIKFIELPEETIYIIDKVVRQRTKAGPIGVDNSELINLEVEDDFKAKNQYLEQLVNGKRVP